MSTLRKQEEERRAMSRATRLRLDGACIIALGRSYERMHRESRALVARHGLTFTQFEVLEALLHKGPLTVNALVEAVLSTGGNITVVVRNLEKCGLVSRDVNPEDGRSFIVCLTEEGRAIIKELFPQHLELLDAALSSLTDEELTSVIGLLKKIADDDAGSIRASKE